MDIQLATLIIIGANIIVSFKGFNDISFFERYKFNISAIKAGQRERTLTSGFLHVDFSHLFLNMLTLYFFAPVVISWFGSTHFLIIYFISLLAGSILAMVFHKNEPFYSAVGASGAVTGILYAAILLQPEMSLFLFFVPIPIPAYVIGIGYMVYSIYGMRKRIGNIGHSAHFGGAVGGFITTLLFDLDLVTRHPLMVGLLALPILLLLLMQRLGKF